MLFYFFLFAYSVLIISHLWRSGMCYLLEIIKPLEWSWKISEIWASSMGLVSTYFKKYNNSCSQITYFCVSVVSITLKYLNLVQPVAFTVYYPHCILSHFQLGQIHYSASLSFVPSSEQGVQSQTRRRTNHTTVKACKHKYNLCNED